MNASSDRLAMVPRALIAGMALMALDRATWADILVEDVEARRGRDLPPRLMSSANGNVIAQYHRDPTFRSHMNAMDAIDADGMPLVFASKLISPTPLPERVATTDFFHNAAAAAAGHGISFYFLGGSEAVNRDACEAVRARYPDLRIAGARDGYFDEADIPGILSDIEESGADVLWVGLGVPKEQAFLANHASRLRGLSWAKSCGGLFDFLAGNYSRAPSWMQQYGLEWLYRAASEPGRLGKRYAATNFSAVWHILTSSEFSLRRRQAS